MSVGVKGDKKKMLTRGPKVVDIWDMAKIKLTLNISATDLKRIDENAKYEDMHRQEYIRYLIHRGLQMDAYLEALNLQKALTSDIDLQKAMLKVRSLQKH